MLMMSDDKGISTFPESDNLLEWVETIHGAAGTGYEDLRYSGPPRVSQWLRIQHTKGKIPHTLLTTPT